MYGHFFNTTAKFAVFTPPRGLSGRRPGVSDVRHGSTVLTRGTPGLRRVRGVPGGCVMRVWLTLCSPLGRCESRRGQGVRTGPHNQGLRRERTRVSQGFAFLLPRSEVHLDPQESSDSPRGDSLSQRLLCACCHRVHSDPRESQGSL